MFDLPRNVTLCRSGLEEVIRPPLVTAGGGHCGRWGIGVEPISSDGQNAGGGDLSPPPSVPLDMLFFLFLGSPGLFLGVFLTSASNHASPSTIDFRFVLAADEGAKSDIGWYPRSNPKMRGQKLQSQCIAGESTDNTCSFHVSWTMFLHLPSSTSRLSPPPCAQT